MKASITSEQVRAAGNIVRFDIDEANYSPNLERILTKLTSLNGITEVIDWGVSEGLRIININNIMLSQSDYNILVGMSEDNTYTFLFGYRETTWKIAIERVSGVKEGNKYKTTITLQIISKYTDLESS